ncbi:MAG: energy-coupling factor transporter ATPase, partial [Eubacterium sp.]
GVDFTVAPGEFVGIIGHNGSGKSTLSKLLNAIILPTKGQVLIKGMDTRDPENLWNIRQTAGMVFQNPDNQLVATIVEEDVAFGPENLGVEPAEIRRRVDECLATVSMGEYRRQKPHQLSGGQKQRIAIAGILAMEPECIIFDEPTAMLDPSGRREVMETIKTLNRDKGMTVLHITHYMTELIDADRIIVLDGGQVVMEGTPREIFRQVTALKAIGLDVPQMTELAFLLRESGLDIPDDLLHIEEMAGALCL